MSDSDAIKGATDSVPLVLILTPVFNEEANLDRYSEVVEKVLLPRTDVRVEVVFIDDGSRDDSWRKIRAKCDEPGGRYHGLRLSRNFGPHAALAAGLEFADADAVAVLACDLQDPAETVGEFIDSWKEGAKIVFGHRKTRKDSASRVLSSKVFNSLLRRTAMPRHSKFSTGSFLLADRQVVESYRAFGEHNRVTFAMMAWTGFDQAIVEYEREERREGSSGWSFGRMFKAFYDVFIGYSHLPIRLISLVGFFTFLLSIAIMVYAITKGIRGASVPGWASTLAVAGFFFSIQFFLMSLVGEYLYRMYLEVVRRPIYFVSEKISTVKPKRDSAGEA